MAPFVFLSTGSTQDQEQGHWPAKSRWTRAAGTSWWWPATDAARCWAWTTSRTWRARVRAAQMASTLTRTSLSAECPLNWRMCKTFYLCWVGWGCCVTPNLPQSSVIHSNILSGIHLSPLLLSYLGEAIMYSHYNAIVITPASLRNKYHYSI